MSIKSNVKKVISKGIKITYNVWNRFVPVDEKVVLFVSHHGRGYSCNPKYIYEEMSRLEEFKDYTFVWAVKKKYETQIEGSKVIRYNSIKYLYYLAKSKYWVINCKLPQYVIKKNNQIYLQTWHGTPLKRLAHDIQGKEEMTFYRSEMTREEMLRTYDVDAKKYDYFISPNEFSTEKFQSAFHIKRDIIIETGYPRVDYIVNSDSNEIVKLKRKYSIPEDKKVILYAPTWRDNSYTNNGYEYEVNADFTQWKEKLGDDYIVIFKPHYLIVNSYNNKGLEDFIYVISEDIDINELYVISDLLITDYSSVFFDYAVLEKPILFYMYDLEEYKDDLRGFYLDIYKDLPGNISRTTNDLIKNIYNLDKDKVELKEKIKKFNEKFNKFNDGNATKRVIDLVFKK